MTQRNVRGAYVCFAHDRAADWDWLAKWQPNVIRYMAPGKPEDPNSVDVGRVKRIHDTCPDATILMRVWEVDDRNFAAHDAMVKEPLAEAERQVDWWARLFDRIAIAGVPREQLIAGLNNETGPDKDGPLFDYTEAALKFGIQKQVRLGVFVFSVGRPSLAGEQQYDMPYFAKLEPLILQAKSVVVLHEYMQPEGMYAVWTDDQGKERKDYTYLIGRHARWPFSPAVPVIIGEWGVNGLLYNRHPDKVYGDSGWTNFKEWPPSRYADEYVECIRKASDNVIGICPYIEDWNDHKWQSFDLIGAYGEFLARKDLCVRDDNQTPAAPPTTTFLPSVGAGPTEPPTKSATLYVSAPAGLNIRDAAATGNIVARAPFGSPVTVTGVSATDPWVAVRYQDKAGWAASAYLAVEPPKPQPEPVQPSQPSGDNWSRVWPITLEIEGGLSTDRNDPGNYRPNGEFVGTRWGISARAHPDVDIVNLTKDQALAIYKRDYWNGSGANGLQWPLCLLHFDAYVQNEAAAQKFLAASGGNPDLYMANRIEWYTTIDNWGNYGKGWMRRCARMLREAAKP